jgi:AhpD family alkylhydroperoxidase
MSMDEKTKELVALGAAIGGNCIPCLEWHFKRCVELGVAKNEIQEAIDMATKVKNVPITKISETAKRLMEDI